MTESQILALKWLKEHTGDGAFNKYGVVLAAGETAPFMRITWNALKDLGLVEFYNPYDKGYGRIRIIKL